MSSQSGWYPNQARYYSTSNIDDPNGWSDQKLIGNNSTYYSQPTSIMTVTENGRNSYIYLGDRWVPSALGSSTYIWLPLNIDTNARTMSMSYAPGWKFDASTGKIVMPDVDLMSRNKPVYADPGQPQNDQTQEDSEPNTANDGQDTLADFWAKGNRFYAQNHVPYTWTVDLGEQRDPSRVDTSFATCNGSESTYGYILKGTNDAITSKADADKAHWTVLKDNRDNTQVAFTSDTVAGAYRYVQIEVTSVTNDHNGNSTADWEDGLIEVSVYAKRNTTIPVEAISLRNSDGVAIDDLHLTKGDVAQLKAVVMPKNSTNPNVSWFSGDAGIASVSVSGKVTAVGEGTTMIGVTANADPSKRAQIAVTVTDNAQRHPGNDAGKTPQHGAAKQTGSLPRTGGHCDARRDCRIVAHGCCGNDRCTETP